MLTPYRPLLERLRYWQGQTLRSVDARDQQRFDALRRQLHNRALHAVGGVAFGLGVARSEDHPQDYEVACGMAYDARGRELILQRTRRIAAPSGPGVQMLRLKQRAGAAPVSTCCTPGDSGCVAADARLLEQDAELAWGSPASFEPASEVILARFGAGVLDTQFVPPQARPIARPRLATGATVQGDTPWEPWVVERQDGAGGILSEVVGVQTHIDTSASGFTQTPRYVASLQASAWDLDTADFAPAFFPQVADAAPDGFTFRLLMSEIGRRRYSAANDIGRVASIKREIGDRLVVEVDALASFKVGDVVAQLRPRASAVVALEKIDGNKLTLAAELALEAGVTMLAVGNLPRMATVLKELPEDPTMVVAFTATLAVTKGDLLQRTSDAALAVIDKVSKGKLTVGKPFPDWKARDALMVARMAASAEVKKAALSADGASLVLELKSATHGVELGMSIVLLGADKLPRATTPKVTSRSGAIVEVQPVPPAAEMAGLTSVLPLAGGITIHSLQPKTRSAVAVSTLGPFAVGDVVAAADDLAKFVLVEQLNQEGKQLELSAPLPVKAGSMIVGVNWQGATTVDVFEPKFPNTVTVGRANAALAGDIVALRDEGGFAMPLAVASVADTILTLDAALADAARLDTLAVGRFPRLVTVLAQEADPAIVSIAEAGALNPGDCVMHLATGAAPAAARAVVQVASVSGAQVVLSDSPGLLAPGDRLALVHWRDLVLVKKVDAAAPTRIEVDGAVDFREGDVVGRFFHHADCSNPGYIEKVEGTRLTLLAGLEHGDGIVDQGWIDGGIVGQAAVSLPLPSPLAFPAWQPLVRMKTVEGLDGRTAATAYGLDLLSGQFVSRPVFPLVVGGAGTHLFFYPQGVQPYRFRPEKLSLITRFNADFPRAFATFAQKQRLVVRWIGCQQEFSSERGCPAQEPYDVCLSASSAAIPEGS